MLKDALFLHPGEFTLPPNSRVSQKVNNLATEYEELFTGDLIKLPTIDCPTDSGEVWGSEITTGYYVQIFMFDDHGRHWCVARDPLLNHNYTISVVCHKSFFTENSIFEGYVSWNTRRRNIQQQIIVISSAIAIKGNVVGNMCERTQYHQLVQIFDMDLDLVIESESKWLDVANHHASKGKIVCLYSRQFLSFVVSKLQNVRNNVQSIIELDYVRKFNIPIGIIAPRRDENRGRDSIIAFHHIDEILQCELVVDKNLQPNTIFIKYFFDLHTIEHSENNILDGWQGCPTTLVPTKMLSNLFNYILTNNYNSVRFRCLVAMKRETKSFLCIIFSMDKELTCR